MTSHTDENLHHNTHDDMGGFRRDLEIMSRRRLLGLVGGIGTAVVLGACRDSTLKVDATTSSLDVNRDTLASSDATVGLGGVEEDTSLIASSGDEIPNETAGPFPADGTNGPNVLKDGAVVRQDFTTSFGEYSGTAPGVPARFTLMVVDAATGAALSGVALYAWHCTSDGKYSIYEVENQNYLRGLQVADELGVVRFDTIFPGCYRGRWPHVHFEVFDGLTSATSGSATLKTSQLALPEAACRQVYADAAYANSVGALGAQSLSGDGVFRDGWTEQLATATGSNADGWDVSLLIRV